MMRDRAGLCRYAAVSPKAWIGKVWGHRQSQPYSTGFDASLLVGGAVITNIRVAPWSVTRRAICPGMKAIHCDRSAMGVMDDSADNEVRYHEEEIHADR